MVVYDGQEDLDNLVWDKNDEDSEEGIKRMRLTTTCRKVEDLAREKFGKPATLISPLVFGGFNVLYRISLEGVTPDVMVRLPCPSLVQFPVEKTLQEAATAAFIKSQTQLPIPRQLLYGQESPVGPFLIMDRVEHCGSVSKRLTRPSDDPSSPHVLDPNVPDAIIEAIWSKIAHCLLQLSRMTFPRIGALEEVSKGTYDVCGRPITHNMADMVRLANVPQAVLVPQGKTFKTADDWYIALAEMHIAQLIFQHNDSVTSEDDCRNKYVARQIFRRLAKQGRLAIFGFVEDEWSAQSSKLSTRVSCPAPPGSDSFRLWGDDFRAGNILLAETDEIAALIDWEYTYVAPTQFILDPPWWLLLETAELWESGIDDWKRTYAIRLQTWLSAMEKAESATLDHHPLPMPLSTYMRESWETGRFFLSYGARKSWAFDCVYWNFLDERFFGDRDSGTSQDELWKTRIHLLTEEERGAMEPFVKRKMAESQTRSIVEWEPAEAQRLLSEHLFE